MPKFAVYIKNSAGERRRIIEPAKSPEKAAGAVATRLKQAGEVAIIMKVKALNDFAHLQT